MKNTLLTKLLAGALLACASHGFAQGTAITYQAQLKDAAGPASGTYDLRFSLYDAASAGNVIGAPITVAPLSVTGGVFTARLDFGVAAFNGAGRWLEIAVRTNGSVAAYATLTPRQLITAAPYAITAGSAASVPAANLTGTVSANQLPANVAKLDANETFTGQVNFMGGNLGIGKGNPAAKLDVEGSIQAHALSGGASLVLYGSGGNLQKFGATVVDDKLFLGRTSGPGAGVNSDLCFDNLGKVGLGTATPEYPLHVKSGWGFLGLDTLTANQDSGLRLIEAGVPKWHIFNCGGCEDKLLIGSAGVVAMTATQTSNIGFGNIDPSPDPTEKVTVNGSLKLSGTGSLIFPDGSAMSSAASLATPIPVQVEVTTVGASAWQVPSGVSRLRFRVWGAGGGGSNRSAGGGGGGGGGFAQYVVMNPVAGEYYDLTVGAGGAVNAAGGLSKVVRRNGTVTLATANGGARGSSATGGAGGTAPTGQVRARGYAGDDYDGVDYYGYGGWPALDELQASGSYGIGGNGLDPDGPSAAEPGEQGYILIEY